MKFSRRELLGLMLGAPALVSGCSSSPILPAQGSLLGQSSEIGHKIRNGFRPRPTDDRWEDVKVVIVGAGASGLSAAWQLKRSGCDDFVVLELEQVCGGTSRSDRCDLTPYPWGAHYLPVPLAGHSSLIELLREMQVVTGISDDGSPVVDEAFLARDPDERLFIQGEWIEGLYPASGASAEDVEQFAAFQREVDRWVEWRDSAGRRAFAIPTSLASVDPEVTGLDKFSMAEWLKTKEWTSPRLHWLVDYCCRDDYGMTAEQTSAWAGLLYFAGRLSKPGAEHQALITWPEGNGRLISYLVDQVGERVRPGMAVTQIYPRCDNGPIEVVAYDTARESVLGFRAQNVIFAAPQFLAPYLIDGFRDESSRKTNEFEYGSWIVANLHLSQRPKERSYPLCWDNVIFGSRSLGYVVATHQSGRDHGPTVLTWYYPFCENDIRGVREQLLNASWADLAHVVLADLERPHPDIRRLTTRLDIFRWGHAMIRPRPGFVTSRQRREAVQPFQGIHFVNTDLSGVALFEEAFDHGCRAARKVL